MDWVYVGEGHRRIRLRWWPSGRLETETLQHVPADGDHPRRCWQPATYATSTPRRRLLAAIDYWTTMSTEARAAMTALLRQRYADWEPVRAARP